MLYISPDQFKRMRHLLPLPRGNVRISYFRFLNALAYMASNGSKWRALPPCFGPWHTVYMRFQLWAQSGLLNAKCSAICNSSA